MYVGAMEVDLHIPDCRSLKGKRAVVKPLVEGIRRRFHVSVSEVACQDKWQRARIGVAVVSSSPAHATDVLDEVERFGWSFPEVQVLDATRHWREGTG